MKMKLSDAIMLGDVVIKKRDAHSYCGCAIGMAVASLTGEQGCLSREVYEMAAREWPFLVSLVYPPAGVGCLSPRLKYSVETIISHAFWQVCDGGMSLESLVDMVRDIESQFPEQSIEQPTATAVLESVAVH